MLNGPRRKFCEGIVSGETGTAAYRAAYPRSAASTARRRASALLTKPEIKAEIARMRALADEKAGSAVLTLMEKRMFLARVVRAAIGLLSEDSDLWQSVKRTKGGIEFRFPDKLRAIEIDNDLAGTGSQAEANDELTELLRRIRY